MINELVTWLGNKDFVIGVRQTTYRHLVTVTTILIFRDFSSSPCPVVDLSISGVNTLQLLKSICLC